MKPPILKAALLTLLCSFFANYASAEPATAPSTETLLSGDIVFTPPDGWKMEGRSKDGRRVGYSHADPSAVMVVNADPQQSVLDDSAAPKIGQTVMKQVTDNAARSGLELISPPKMEPDDRFFLRVHHQYKKGNEIADQLQIYRVVGLNLVAVAVTVFATSPDQIKTAFGEAETTLTTVKSAKQAGASAHSATKMKPATRPTALPNAKIIFNGPAGWDEQTNDNTSGIVATYHDPAESFNTLVVSVRPLPPEAKKDPKMRDALVDEIVRGETTQFKFDGANPVGDTEIVKDNRFLKKERTRYQRPDAKIQVTGRQRRIGDVVVSVAMASLESSAADIDKLADEVMMSVRAVGH